MCRLRGLFLPECLKHPTLFGDAKSTNAAALEGIISYFEESGYQIGAMATMLWSHLPQIPIATPLLPQSNHYLAKMILHMKKTSRN